MSGDGDRVTGERADDGEPIGAKITTRAEPLARVQVRSIRWGERLKRAAWVTYGTGMLGFWASMLATQMFYASTAMPPWLGLGALASMAVTAASPLLTLAGMIAGRSRTLGPASVAVERGALAITWAGEHLELAPLQLIQGAVQPGGTLVVDDDRGRRFTIEGSEARAAELLDALELEPEKRRFVFAWERALPRVMGLLGGLVASFAALSIPISYLEHTHAMGAYSCFLFTAPWLVAQLVSRWMARRQLAVGLDGIEAKSRKGRALLRFADIEEVRDVGASLEVKTRDGVVHRLLADPADPAVAAAIRERIREALALARVRAGKATIASALLERAGQSLGEWRASVAKILTAATGFRGAAVGAHELREVLDDVTATAEQRLAAAIALGADPASRPRIRVAAQASVSPRLRVALEQLAEGDAEDAVIEAALVEHRGR